MYIRFGGEKNPHEVKPRGDLLVAAYRDDSRRNRRAIAGTMLSPLALTTSPHPTAFRTTHAAIDLGCMCTTFRACGSMMLTRGRLHRMMRIAGLSHPAHIFQRLAAFIENAQHLVTVKNQCRNVRDRRSVVHGFFLAGDAREEIAHRLLVAQELSELHPDPCRIHHTHIDGKQLREPIEFVG